MPRTQEQQRSRYREAKPYATENSKPGRSGQRKEPPMPTSLTACKKQVRNVSRLLKRDNLDSATRVDLERRLKALNILQSQMSNAQTDKANASRYHGIKFFERKKIIRKLSQLEKKMETAENKQELESKQHELLVNLNYTTYYPNEFKYISLYPADPSKTTEETKERQKVIREKIAQAMDVGDLPKDPRLVNAEDRKAIRKNNKLLLRTVSLAHNANAEYAEPGSDDGSDQEEEDEFFA
ncbi:18S rRNA maturation protein [Coemansia brasiliensis]|uniref:rRNA-processing protein EFG1 n=1 Tax=Coemansia brasiliensis TaxID=2650707 RepID=A0A9W8I4M6_9FUNG|nr:18S rRNA maturation protein [Coemansia brasiliensis]